MKRKDIYADFKLKQWFVQKYFSDVWVQIVYSAEVNENKELRRQWQESHTLCQAAEVEKDKLSELVQLLQQRYATIQYFTSRTLMSTTVVFSDFISSGITPDYQLLKEKYAFNLEILIYAGT